jgi:hypothetical protein
MKKSILLILIICFAIRAFAQTHFTFSGKISGKANYVALFYINSSGQSAKEICPLKNGLFNIKGNTIEPHEAFFYSYDNPDEPRPDDNNPNGTIIFLEPGSIVATGSYGHLKSIQIKGSKTEDEYMALERQLQHPVKKHDDIKFKYINEHPASFISAFSLTFYLERLPVNLIRKVYDGFRPAIQNSIYGKQIKREINAIDNSAIGKPAANFSSVDVNGKPISLSDFKGHYVLLDFLASWCVPCRQANPHLIQLFKKYNSKGLDVIGIADDDGNINGWKMVGKKLLTKIKPACGIIFWKVL